MSILGQNPADAANSLRRSSNLLDVPDKAVARTNLDVPSKSEVQYAGVPIGTIVAYWGSVAPSGYLPCSGQTVTSGAFPALVTFLGGTTSAVVPDLRGEFLRGWDNGRNIDAGRTNLGLQLDAFQGHWHDIYGSPSGASASGAAGQVFNTSAQNTIVPGNNAVRSPTTDGTNGTPRTAAETRPRNISVLYCIKAYDSVLNYTSSLNIAGLVSDYSTLAGAAVKYADLTGTNQLLQGTGYQKLPGGMIIQWGSAPALAINGSQVVTLPLVFPAANLFVSTISNTGSSIASAGVSVTTRNLNNFTMYGHTGGGPTYQWFALGY